MAAATARVIRRRHLTGVAASSGCLLLGEALEYLRAYIDDLLVITRGTLEDHLEKLGEVLRRLRETGLKKNAAKSFFCTHKIEYLGYMLTRGGIKP